MPNSIFRRAPPPPIFCRPLRSWPARYSNLPLGLTSRRANPSFVSSSLLCLASASFRPLRPGRHNPSLLSLRHHDPQHHSLLPNLITSTRLPVPAWIEPCYSPTRPASTTRTHVSTSNCHLPSPLINLLHASPALGHRSCHPSVVCFVFFFFFLSFFFSSTSRRSHRPTAASVVERDTLTYALSTLHRARRIALVRSTASIVSRHRG